MRVTKRRQQILSILQQRGTVSVVELADGLDVSQNTIRNDLDALDEHGALTRVHGGALLSSPAVPPQFRPKDSPRLHRLNTSLTMPPPGFKMETR